MFCKEFVKRLTLQIRCTVKDRRHNFVHILYTTFVLKYKNSLTIARVLIDYWLVHLVKIVLIKWYGGSISLYINII
jgi:hypothetical protein